MKLVLASASFFSSSSMVVLLKEINFGSEEGFENWISNWVMVFLSGKSVNNDIKPVFNYFPKYPKCPYYFGLQTKGQT